MKTTLHVMIAIGLFFWVLAIVLPGWDIAMLIFSALLVSWSVGYLYLLKHDYWDERGGA